MKYSLPKIIMGFAIKGVQIEGLKWLEIHSPTEFLYVIREAVQKRNTRSTSQHHSLSLSSLLILLL